MTIISKSEFENWLRQYRGNIYEFGELELSASPYQLDQLVNLYGSVEELIVVLAEYDILISPQLLKIWRKTKNEGEL